MAIKNKKKLGTYQWIDNKDPDNTLTLSSTLENLNSLEQDVGKKMWLYFGDCNDPMSAAKLFFHMQVPAEGEQPETEKDIYETFFSDGKDWASASVQERLIEVMAILVGVDKAELLAQAEATQKKPAAKKGQAAD